jgi:hypothetical protein
LIDFRVPLPEPGRDCGKQKRKFGRPQLDRALRSVQRSSRSSARREEALRVAPRGCARPLRGIGFRSLTEAIDTTTLQSVLVFHMFSALAGFDRALITKACEGESVR